VSALDIRKLLTLVETTKSEMGHLVDPPTRKASALAVITNPFAGRDSKDLSALIDIGGPLEAGPCGRSRIVVRSPVRPLIRGRAKISRRVSSQERSGSVV
jgi:hypothetical protein